jgi:serine/threonine protein phosphatase PrpC
MGFFFATTNSGTTLSNTWLQSTYFCGNLLVEHHHRLVMTLNSFEDNLISWFLRKTASTAVRRVADLPAVLASSVGLVRKENQDRVATLRFADFSGCEYLLVVLCDGMGGMADGAKCAAMAIASFSSAVVANINRFHAERTLHEAALTANRRVYENYRGVGGATLSALLILPNNDQHYWVNLGDSRIYEYRDNVLNQLTIDDTLAGQLARESESYIGRNELLQFVGMGEAAEPHVGRIGKSANDSTYLITSDGVHFLPSNMLRELMHHAPEHAISAKRLIDLAMWCGGHDNASLALASFSRESWSTLPPLQLDVIEIWDPYGDARFFGVSRYYHRKNAQAFNIPNDLVEATGFVEKQGDVATQNLDGGLEKKSATNEPQLPADKVEQQTPKRKKSLKKKVSAPEQVGKPSEPLPQLTINFRKKD